MVNAWVNDKLRFGRPVTKSNGAGATIGASVQWSSQYELFVRELVNELRRNVRQVQRVLVREQKDYVSVYVLCSGNLDELEDQVYVAEGEVLARFPGVLIDLHLLESDRADIASLVIDAREVLASQ